MQSSIFFPVLVQALLSLALLPMLGAARARSLRELDQTLDDEDVRLGTNRWTEQAVKVANCYKNQFEIPTLFFAVVAFALIFRQADPLLTALAWVFVATRLAHAAIHVGPNIVRWRGAAFLSGVVVLLAMWLILAWRVAGAA